MQQADTEQVSPARRWGVSGCLSRRTRQGADARPLTIPASGGLRATLRAVPSSLPAADGPAGRAIRGTIRPFADLLSALLASVHFSALRTPLVKSSSVISLTCIWTGFAWWLVAGITSGGCMDTFFFLTVNASELKRSADSCGAHSLQRRSTKQRKKEITARG